MKHLTTFVLLVFLMALPQWASAQKVEKKFKDKLCQCSGKIDPKQEDNAALYKEVTNCIDIAVAITREDIKKEFAGKDNEEIRAIVDGWIVGTAKECETFKTYYLKLERENKDNANRADEKHAVAEDCKPMHDGTFRYVKENAKTTYISRKGNLQYEGHDGSPYYIHSRIEWLDDCTYVSTFWETNDPELKGLFKRGQKITVVITSVDGNTFSYYTNLSGANINEKMMKESDEFIDPTK